MQPQEILAWLRATPFVPFRIWMKSGRTYDVRHPEFVRVLPRSVMLFTPTEEAGLYDRAEMMSLVLIVGIEPLLATATSSGS
jgi:hypothetical protein